MLRRTPLLLLSLSIALALVLTSGCGPQTAESATARYQRAKDSLDVLKTKMPSMKTSIDEKLVAFDKEFQEAVAKGGEAGVAAMTSIARRVEDFEKKLNPQTATTATPAKSAGSKLKTPAAPAAPGGKLAAPAAADLSVDLEKVWLDVKQVLDAQREARRICRAPRSSR